MRLSCTERPPPPPRFVAWIARMTAWFAAGGGWAAAMKASPPPGGKAAAAAVELIGDQASVVALVEIFLASEPDAAGKVTQESLFKALRACGCLTGNAKALEGMSFRSLGVEDVVRLVHPDMGRARASQLIHNAKRYIKDCEARQRKRHCQLYHDIKDNRMQVTEETKTEAMRLFSVYDADHDHMLSAEEFVDAVSTLYDEDMARQLFKLVDINENGSINTWEFIAYWTMGFELAADDVEVFHSHLLGIVDGTHTNQELKSLLRVHSATEVSP
mmetsp:Transcript_3568/g.7002  ORF Transcript_3568/g.7002 Transcript_3568/m.7002 type:complete len:273 (+) Transcript_3568:1175-1993(+)